MQKLRQDDIQILDATLEDQYELLKRQLIRFRTIKDVFLFFEAVLLISLAMLHNQYSQQPTTTYWWLLLAWAVAGIAICFGPWSITGQIKRAVMLINTTAEGTVLQYEAEDQIRRIGDISQGADPLNPIYLHWVANAFTAVWLLLGGAAILRWNQVVPLLLIIGGAIGLLAFTYDKILGRRT